jgi:hypothetical protein
MTNTQLHTCKHCGDKFTVVDRKIKRAREIHEAKFCPKYWEQDD